MPSFTHYTSARIHPLPPSRLYAKQLPSPLKHSVEMLVQARAAAGARGRHGLHTADHQDMAPSYMSAQHSALVQGWDYVAP